MQKLGPSPSLPGKCVLHPAFQHRNAAHAERPLGIVRYEDNNYVTITVCTKNLSTHEKTQEGIKVVAYKLVCTKHLGQLEAIHNEFLDTLGIFITTNGGASGGYGPRYWSDRGSRSRMWW